MFSNFRCYAGLFIFLCLIFISLSSKYYHYPSKQILLLLLPFVTVKERVQISSLQATELGSRQLGFKASLVCQELMFLKLMPCRFSICCGTKQNCDLTTFPGRDQTKSREDMDGQELWSWRYRLLLEDTWQTPSHTDGVQPTHLYLRKAPSVCVNRFRR